MKKTYISPVVNVHLLRVESMLISPSKIRGVDFGNKHDFGETEYVPDYRQTDIDVIESIEGDEWETL